MGSTTTATALSDKASKDCCVLIFTPDNQYVQPKMKKVNKQCLLDTPRTVRVSEKT